MHVYLVVFDKSSFGLSKKLFSSIHQYIDEHYVEEIESTFQRNRLEEHVILDYMARNQNVTSRMYRSRRALR